jgi:hypothetical protein
MYFCWTVVLTAWWLCSCALGLEDELTQTPKFQPTLVNIVAVVLCIIFLVGVVIMITIFHRLKIKRYISFYDKHCKATLKLVTVLVH